MHNNNFGRKLREARELREISLNELARRVGISSAYISMLENGKHKQPSRDIMISLAKELNVDIKYLIDDSIESPFAIFDMTKEDMPEDIKSFLLEQDSLPWVRLIKDCRLNDVTADDARAIIEAVLQIRKSK